MGVSEGHVHALWDEISLAGEAAERNLLGATDSNRDGIPELIFREVDYEYIAYSVYTFENDEFPEIVNIEGGL